MVRLLDGAVDVHRPGHLDGEGEQVGDHAHGPVLTVAEGDGEEDIDPLPACG